jgi:hypothetical protein
MAPCNPIRGQQYCLRRHEQVTTLYIRPPRRHHKRRFTCSSMRIKAGQVEAALTYGSKTAVHRKSMTQKCGETLNPRAERERPGCPARGLAGWRGERRIAVLLAGVMRMGEMMFSRGGGEWVEVVDS